MEPETEARPRHRIFFCLARIFRREHRLSSTSFHVVSHTWFPLLQPPNHVLSPFPASPERITYTVQAPGNFLLLAPGKRVGRTKNGGEVKSRFELRSSDPAPFVVAGRYVDSCSNGRGAGPPSGLSNRLREIGRPPRNKLHQTGIFSRRISDLLGIRILLPTSRISRTASHWRRHAVSCSFFGGVLVDPQEISQGVHSGEFLDLVAHALAAIGSASRYIRRIQRSHQRGLSEYAVIVIDESASRRFRAE